MGFFEDVKNILKELFYDGQAIEAVVAKLQGNEEFFENLEDRPHPFSTEEYKKMGIDDPAVLEVLGLVTGGKSKIVSKFAGKGGRNYDELVRFLTKVKNPTQRQIDYLEVANNIVQNYKQRGINPDQVLSHKSLFPEGFELTAKGIGKMKTDVVNFFQKVDAGEISALGDDVIQDATIPKITKDLFGEAAVGKKGLDFTSELSQGLQIPGGEQAAKVTAEGANEAAIKIIEKNALDMAGLNTVKKLMVRFGLSEKESVELINSQKLKDTVKDLATSKKAKILGGTGLTGLTAKGLAGITGTTIGIDVLTNWAALDNIIGAQAIVIRDLVNAAQFGKLDTEVVRERIAESEKIIAAAEVKIETSLKYDPALWISKKLWQTAIESNRNFIENQMVLLEGVKTSNIENDRLKEEEIKRDKFERQDLEEFRNKQEQQQIERNEAFARRQKDSASVGTRGLTQAQPERKAREIPSKLKFGL